MDPVVAKLLGFGMVLTRTSAFFLVLPVFGWRSIPRNIKVAATVLTSVFFSITVPFSTGPEPISTFEAILLLGIEAVYGFTLGLIAALVFYAVRLSGNIIEQQMGFTMAQILDPLTGESAQPLGMFFEMIFIILFLSANGHHLFLLALNRSYQAFPAGSMPTVPVLVQGVVEAGSTLLVAGLRLAAPLLAAFLLLMVVLAVLARIAPEMNILFISFPLRVGLGLLLIGILLPFINAFVAEFADWMGVLLPL
ncbi:MAG: flagellar biosynthetic protein FliR [Phycisphaerales bacterium]|nr:MAG: flagellar biosynthetic protein FliR [Phycisphaerales bacterium]